MHGFWKMLTGEGENLNREKRRRFREAIPDSFPFVIGSGEEAVVRTGPGNQDFRPATKQDQEILPSHPAYSGEFENTMMASNYKKAVYGGGGPMPKPKVEVKPEPETAAETWPVDFMAWLERNGIPLPKIGGK